MEHLLFIGPQLVALSSNGGTGSRSGNIAGGKAGVWHTSTQHWQVQDIAPLTSFDTAGSFLLLGTVNGAINYIGKFSCNIYRTEISCPFYLYYFLKCIIF